MYQKKPEKIEGGKEVFLLKKWEWIIIALLSHSNHGLGELNGSIRP
jgi:hypothetical protein